MSISKVLLALEHFQAHLCVSLLSQQRWVDGEQGQETVPAKPKTLPIWSLTEKILLNHTTISKHFGLRTIFHLKNWGSQILFIEVINIYHLEIKSEANGISSFFLSTGELCSVLCGSLDGVEVRENGYMYLYTTESPFLSIWNCHNIVDWPYSNIK